VLELKNAEHFEELLAENLSTVIGVLLQSLFSYSVAGSWSTGNRGGKLFAERGGGLLSEGLSENISPATSARRYV